MKATFQVTNPRFIEFTMAITMTLDDWVKLNRGLRNEYPDWQLAEKIGEMIDQAELTFMPRNNNVDL